MSHSTPSSTGASSTTSAASPSSTTSTSLPTTSDQAAINAEALLASGQIRTLDGELAGDEFAAMAVDYQILLGKIDRLLEKLKLDA
jgi:hypothetical protein